MAHLSLYLVLTDLSLTEPTTLRASFPLPPLAYPLQKCPIIRYRPERARLIPVSRRYDLITSRRRAFPGLRGRVFGLILFHPYISVIELTRGLS
jgi:hypothetical protein